jgi:hypothetical protein
MVAYLYTRYADSNVSGLDHPDVVRPVPDGKQDGLLILLDKLYNKRLLKRRDSAADHSLR